MAEISRKDLLHGMIDSAFSFTNERRVSFQEEDQVFEMLSSDEYDRTYGSSSSGMGWRESIDGGGNLFIPRFARANISLVFHPINGLILGLLSPYLCPRSMLAVTQASTQCRRLFNDEQIYKHWCQRLRKCNLLGISKVIGNIKEEGLNATVSSNTSASWDKRIALIPAQLAVPDDNPILPQPPNPNYSQRIFDDYVAYQKKVAEIFHLITAHFVNRSAMRCDVFLYHAEYLAERWEEDIISEFVFGVGTSTGTGNDFNMDRTRNNELLAVFVAYCLHLREMNGDGGVTAVVSPANVARLSPPCASSSSPSSSAYPAVGAASTVCKVGPVLAAMAASTGRDTSNGRGSGSGSSSSSDSYSDSDSDHNNDIDLVMSASSEEEEDEDCDDGEDEGESLSWTEMCPRPYCSFKQRCIDLYSETFCARMLSCDADGDNDYENDWVDGGYASSILDMGLEVDMERLSITEQQEEQEQDCYSQVVLRLHEYKRSDVLGAGAYSASPRVQEVVASYAVRDFFLDLDIEDSNTSTSQSHLSPTVLYEGFEEGKGLCEGGVGVGRLFFSHLDSIRTSSTKDTSQGAPPRASVIHIAFCDARTNANISQTIALPRVLTGNV